MTVETECAHCSRPMKLKIDSDLHIEAEDGCKPIVFIPSVDIINIKDASIINAF